MIKKLKHLFQDSIKDIESAVIRQKKIKKIFWISLIGLFAFGISSGLINIVWLSSLMYMCALVLFFCVAFCAWVLRLLKKYIKKVNQY